MLTEILTGVQFSCIIPAAISICLFKKIEPRYYLLCLMMIVDVVVEVCNHLGDANGFFNLYGCINSMLFLTFIYSNNYLGKKRFQLLFLMVLICYSIVFIKNGMVAKPSYFIISLFQGVHLFIVTDILTKQIFATKSALAANFWFWFSGACVLYYGYALLLFGLSTLGLKSTVYYESMQSIWNIINLTYYLLLSVAIVKISKHNSPSLLVHKLKYN